MPFHRVGMNYRPLSARLAAAHRPETGFGFSEEVLPVPLASQETRRSPVSDLLGSPKPTTLADSVNAITKEILATEQTEERNKLLAEWFEVAGRIEATVAEAKTKKVEKLNAQIAELGEAGRAALSRVRALERTRASLTARVNALEEQRSKARLKLDTARASEPSDDAFPTDAELAAWRRSVAEAESALEQLRVPYGELTAQQQENATAIENEQKNVGAIKKQRQNLRDELAGRPRTGPFGLQEFPG